MDMYPKPKINYLAQIGILIGSVGVLLVFSGITISIVAAGLLHVPLLEVGKALNKVENADMARIMNTVAVFFSVFLPAIIWARVMSRKPFRQLGFNSSLNGKQMFLIVLMSVVAMLVSNFFGEVNQHIPLPSSWMAKAKAIEKMYSDGVAVMASMSNTRDYLVSLLVIAFFPALFEEVLFRGGLQQAFIGLTKKPWLGILITSILFSAFHFSFFGFLSRAALGMVLGYVFYFSRNLWLNIVLHFMNNAIIISVFYSYSRSGKSIADAEKATNGGNAITIISLGFIGIAAIIALFRAFKKESELVRPAELLPENDNPFT
jgi:membrane protease YdiL (CAAX protease family)